MTVDLTSAADRFAAALTGARRGRALSVIDELLADGVDPVTVMVDVVAAAQRTVGDLWQRGEWSVAQEHAATALSVSALESVSRTVDSSVPHRGHAVVACAEHEWHAVPATIIAVGLRLAGWEVTLLGASTPTERLSRYLQDVGPDLVAVSCSVPAGLPTSRSFIETSTAAGIPVLAGGGAFGSDARRANALGATAWAADVRTAVEAADSLPVVVRPAEALPHEVTGEQLALQGHRHALVDAVVFRWQTRREVVGPPCADGEADLLRETVEQVFHAVVGALLTGDGRLVEETATWVGSVLEVRGPGADGVGDLGSGMAAELVDFPVSSALWNAHWPR